MSMSSTTTESVCGSGVSQAITGDRPTPAQVTAGTSLPSLISEVEIVSGSRPERPAQPAHRSATITAPTAKPPRTAPIIGGFCRERELDCANDGDALRSQDGRAALVCDLG